MSNLPSGIPCLPGGWRYRDLAAAVLTLFGLLMLGIGAGSGVVALPFLVFGAFPFALGLAHLWHATRTADASANRSVASPSHRAPNTTAAEDDPVTLLKERYAAGELDDDELDRRLERLVELEELNGDESASKTARREK